MAFALTLSLYAPAQKFKHGMTTFPLLDLGESETGAGKRVRAFTPATEEREKKTFQNAKIALAFEDVLRPELGLVVPLIRAEHVFKRNPCSARRGNYGQQRIDWKR